MKRLEPAMVVSNEVFFLFAESQSCNISQAFTITRSRKSIVLKVSLL